MQLRPQQQQQQQQLEKPGRSELRKLFVLAAIIAFALTLLVAAPSFAAPPSGTPVCVLINNGGDQSWDSCLTIYYSITADADFRITRATATLKNVKTCPGLPTRYSNLWKNISVLEATKTATKGLCGTGPDYQVDYWNAADPARIFPHGTRLHSTWQSVTDTAHPIITLA